jgi:vacuolar-type H+-ATPase subunit H
MIAMQDVLNRIVAVEAEARRQVEAAQAQAAQILARARLAAQAMQAQTHQAVQLETANLLATRLAEATQERDRRLALAAATIAAQIRLDDDTVRQVVDAALRCVCGEEVRP